MKINVFKILLISILSMFSVYSYADCATIRSFKESYSNNFQKNEVFFIKGVALDVYEYGRTVKVIEDLKGNFDDESSVFVWGQGHPSGSGFICPTFERQDNITQYQENDTLIMLVEKSYGIDVCIETSSDYATFTCGYSILKLSNGFVTGRIFPPLEEWGYPEEITMPWKELQVSLNSTAIQSVRIKNNVYQQNGTVFFENRENKVVELSFYDLTGKLIHEAITTSNSYRLVLAGNIFVCKINMNNDIQTIKYIVP